MGDPGTFKAEHSEAEPQLVFFKATTAKPAETNALITTKSGREISLSLISQGKSDHSEEDKAENELCLKQDFRLMSTYAVAETRKLWIITEADRSVTTLLLPEKY